MRVIHSKDPLPKKFLLHPLADECGLHAESEVYVGSSRICAKVLWFKDRRGLRKFWKNLNGFDIGRRCPGVVNSFGMECCSFDKNGREYNTRFEVDPRYFCVMGFSLKDLRENHLEIIPHEAVHAAFSYEKRIKKTPWKEFDFHEEGIAYPAGGISKSLFRIALKHQWI